MARQPVSKDSPAKISAKKVKRLAAAKVMLDLDKEFSSIRTKTEKELAAVDAHPVQMSKKPVVVPALSLAPPLRTEQDIQDSTRKLPATVTVPYRSSAEYLL